MAPKTQPREQQAPITTPVTTITTTPSSEPPRTPAPTSPSNGASVRSPPPTAPPQTVQLTVALDPPRPPSSTPDQPAEPTVPVTVMSQVQYMPVRIRALHSTNLQPSSTVIPVVQGYVVSQIPNVLLIADDTGISVVKHTKGSFTGVTGVSIHFNGGVTVSTNSNFFPVITLAQTATIKRANVPRVDITPFLTANPMERRSQEGLPMVLHLTNRVASSRTTTTNFLCQSHAAESFVLTPYGELTEQRTPNGFYLIINMRKSQSKQGTKVFFYADSQNGSAIFPTDVMFPLADNPTRVDLPPSQTIQSIPEAFSRIDTHALFTFHSATVTGFSYTQPSTKDASQGKRFQKVAFFLGNGGHSANLTVFEEKMWLPENTVSFSVHFVRQNPYGGQCNFQCTDATHTVPCTRTSFSVPH